MLQGNSELKSMCVFVGHFTVQSTQAIVGFFPGDFIGESAELVCFSQFFFFMEHPNVYNLLALSQFL